jgi:hypothetical protein
MFQRDDRGRVIKRGEKIGVEDVRHEQPRRKKEGRSQKKKSLGCEWPERNASRECEPLYDAHRRLQSPEWVLMEANSCGAPSFLSHAASSLPEIERISFERRSGIRRQ